ncbi:MAG: polyprenyl synthetase family protein [Spirochaetes bacterium]|nr:polyprenyl synthetase family protein [Spirochaetota bacterium]
MSTDLKKILAPLDGHLRSVDAEIKKRLHTGIPIIDSSALHLFTGGGKRIRASLVILTSGLGGSVPNGIIPLAAAVEIVHASSLIHDDIIDQSLLRRGDVTVPRKWGNKVAVLAGDYLYSVALDTAIQDGDLKIFPLMVIGTKDMVMGELCQIQYSDIGSVRREHYLQIIELKTARFMGSCAKLGATKGGAGPDECERLYRFGLNWGFAFQIIDDTLDIMQDSDQTGKDVGSDFKDGKVTLPFIYLIEQGAPGDLDLLKAYASNPMPAEWAEIKKRLAAVGAMAYSVRFAERYIDAARGILNTFPDSEYRKILFELSDFLLSRNY